MKNNYEAVIGLEVHAHLLTETKAFCACSTRYGMPPNSNVCPVCLGHPGVLPVLNKKAVEFTVLSGIATQCHINPRSIFARKNYFYPDLPKGYQISQYEHPLCENGRVTITLADNSEKDIRIRRIHLEEDAGKSIHDYGGVTRLDLNRCGIPLIEIVSEPDLSSPSEASQYLQKLRQLLRYLGICDGNMEEGSLRCDANVSVRVKGSGTLGTKTEIKNMNSFRNVEKAIESEIARQLEILSDGGIIEQETLLWDAAANTAYVMRSKEEASDYRYFPEPDLHPVLVSENWIDEITLRMPELPDDRKNRLITHYHLPEYDSEVICSEIDLADYFEKAAEKCRNYKILSNWIMVEVMKILNEQKLNIREFQIPPQDLAGLINLISDNTISGKIAKEIFQVMISEGKSAPEVVKERNLFQITDSDIIAETVRKVIDSNPIQVQEYINGKGKVLGFLIGQIMKETKGKANPKTVQELLKEKLELKRNE